MRARQAGGTAKAPPNRRFRYLLYGVGVLVLLVCGSVSLAGLVMVQKLKDLEQVVSRATQEYEALDAEFPFEPPGPDGEVPVIVPAELSEAYLTTRSALLSRVTPETEGYARAVLNLKKETNAQMQLLLKRGFREFLTESIDVHLASLREQELSPRAFLWVHGAYMRGRLTDESGRAYYGRLMERMGDAAEGRSDGLSSLTHYNALLAARYAPYATGGEQVPEGVHSDSALEGLIDLLLLNYELHRTDEGMEAEGA